MLHPLTVKEVSVFIIMKENSSLSTYLLLIMNNMIFRLLIQMQSIFIIHILEIIMLPDCLRSIMLRILNHILTCWYMYLIIALLVLWQRHKGIFLLIIVWIISLHKLLLYISSLMKLCLKVDYSHLVHLNLTVSLECVRIHQSLLWNGKEKWQAKKFISSIQAL